MFYDHDGKKLEVENPRWQPLNLKYVYLSLNKMMNNFIGQKPRKGHANPKT